MKNNLLLIFLIFFILNGCVGVSSKGIFGTGVSIATDPRTIGTQIDDSIMQKNLSTRILLMNKDYFLAEEYHQQYLAKNPNGYCGLQGTGIECQK